MTFTTLNDLGQKSNRGQIVKEMERQWKGNGVAGCAALTLKGGAGGNSARCGKASVLS